MYIKIDQEIPLNKTAFFLTKEIFYATLYLFKCSEGESRERSRAFQRASSMAEKEAGGLF